MNIRLSNSDGRRPPPTMKIGGRRGRSATGTRLSKLFNFQRSVRPLPPTPCDENDRLRCRTSNSIFEANVKCFFPQIAVRPFFRINYFLGSRRNIRLFFPEVRPPLGVTANVAIRTR